MAPAPLTINAPGMRFWLLEIENGYKARERLLDLASNAKGAERDELSHAFRTVLRSLVGDVEMVRHRGGLLLIGGAA